MFTLIQNGEVYAPDPRGGQSVLIANDTLVRIGTVDVRRLQALDLSCQVIDAGGCYIIPGLIDPHTRHRPPEMSRL